jgi:hypothetical protein
MDLLELGLGYLALCLVAGVAGRNRRIGFWGFLFSSILFTPVVTLLFLYFATPRKVATQRKV